MSDSFASQVGQSRFPVLRNSASSGVIDPIDHHRSTELVGGNQNWQLLLSKYGKKVSNWHSSKLNEIWGQPLP